jgi:hypothetical protein
LSSIPFLPQSYLEPKLYLTMLAFVFHTKFN